MDTPARVARAMEEVCGGAAVDVDGLFSVTFDAGCHDIVVVRDIPFYSPVRAPPAAVLRPGPHRLHPRPRRPRVRHLKLARVVDAYARRPQLQERLCAQVADAVVGHLDPMGVVVVMEAEHLCMTMRGVRKPGAMTSTSAVRGALLPAPPPVPRP